MAVKNVENEKVFTIYFALFNSKINTFKYVIILIFNHLKSY